MNVKFLRTVVALVAVASTLVAATGVASAGDPAGDQYRKYALVRERLISCSLDRTWHQLGTQARKSCVGFRKLYLLWADPGESWRYHVHCQTRKCPAAPAGEPNPRRPIPARAHVFR